KLIFQDSFTRRNLLLTLQRTRANPKLRKVVADLELEKDRYGDFRTDGVYYNYIEKDDSYAYVRFLPNGKRLSTKLSLPPEEALSRINMAYIFRDGGQVQLNAANYNDDLTSGLTSSEDREGTTEFSYEVLEDGDKMTEFYYFKSVGKGPSGARIEEASYEFYPTTELAYWTPKKEYEDCPHLNLPLVVPESTDEIFKVVESMPRFPCPRCDGGTGDESKRQLAYLSYIYKNLQYEQAEENQGIAVITFIIERNGRVAEPRIVRPINEHCGQAALAVAEKMIADGITWTPGKSEGVPMRVRYNMPVKFKLGK
ncbi:MAG: energy transducer TonB, partial [Bacteroidota bacterium]